MNLKQASREVVELQGGYRRRISERLCDVLAHRLFNFRDPVRTLQQFARFWTIGRADDAVLFHQVDQMSRAAVSDAQAALQKGSRGFAEFNHQTHGVIEEGIVVVLTASATFSSRVAGLAFFAGGLQE